jgi:hypothetical protein
MLQFDIRFAVVDFHSFQRCFKVETVSIRDHGYTSTDIRHSARVEELNEHPYLESLQNLTPADIYFGRGDQILQQRKRTKQNTLNQRRLQHRKQTDQSKPVRTAYCCHLHRTGMMRCSRWKRPPVAGAAFWQLKTGAHRIFNVTDSRRTLWYQREYCL